MALTLHVGSRRYSSWSLRPYLALAHTRRAFETRTILLDRPTTRAAIAPTCPADVDAAALAATQAWRRDAAAEADAEELA